MKSASRTEDVHIVAFEAMPSPRELHAKAPITPRAAKTVTEARRVLQHILERRDPRLFVVVGPCSIHDPKAGLEYAARLRKLAAEVSDALYLVMRVYFEKPRTVSGWKGFRQSDSSAPVIVVPLTVHRTSASGAR